MKEEKSAMVLFTYCITAAQSGKLNFDPHGRFFPRSKAGFCAITYFR
jgi:hypothetical protein